MGSKGGGWGYGWLVGNFIAIYSSSYPVRPMLGCMVPGEVIPWFGGMAFRIVLLGVDPWETTRRDCRNFHGLVARKSTEDAAVNGTIIWYIYLQSMNG